MTSEIPDFRTAVEQFRDFLTQIGHPPDELNWIFREDVSTCRRRVLVRVPLPADNEGIAAARYEQGRAVGVGVCLFVYCRLGTALCCSTWFVKDHQESARRLCGGLKLSAPLPANVDVSQPVWDRRTWRAWRRLDRESGLAHFRNFLPPRRRHRRGARPPPSE